jgi:hypothetical protein
MIFPWELLGHKESHSQRRPKGLFGRSLIFQDNSHLLPAGEFSAYWSIRARLPVRSREQPLKSGLFVPKAAVSVSPTAIYCE